MSEPRTNLQLIAEESRLLRQVAGLKDDLRAARGSGTRLEDQLRREREANEKLREEIKSGDEMYEAQQQKYADCPHKPISGEVNECGCSFDKIGDICAYHAPALKAAQTTISRQANDFNVLIELGNSRLREIQEQAATISRQESALAYLRALQVTYEVAANNLWTCRDCGAQDVFASGIKHHAQCRVQEILGGEKE